LGQPGRAGHSVRRAPHPHGRLRRHRRCGSGTSDQGDRAMSVKPDLRYRVGVDIGGTFTDFTLFDDAAGTVRTHKQLTTPHDPAEAVIEGTAILAKAAGIAPREIGSVVHGTTLVTN